MKYLAILKDSFREAIDTKVFYVMVGFSCLLTLLIASISYRPVPADEALRHIITRFSVVYRDRGESLEAGFQRVKFELTDLEQLNDASEPQAGDYRFILTMPEDKFREAAAFWNSTDDPDSKERIGPVSLPQSVLEEFLKKQFSMFGNLEVTRIDKVRAPSPDMMAFQLETKGTRGVRGWLHDPCLFFGAVPLRIFRQSLGFIVYWIEDALVNGIGAWIAILIGIVITAFFIPNMLHKGTIDLLLVKPIYRTTLLTYKFIGGLTFIFLNSAVAVLGIWLAVGIQSGIWATGFLVSIMVLTFFFAILYSVSTLFGVLTRSAIVAILMSCLAWFVLWLVGTGYSALDLIRKDPRLSKQIELPSWVYSTVDVLHFALPRTKDLDLLTGKLLSREIMTEGEIRNSKLDRLPPVTWSESLTVSGIFIGLMLGVACWRFATKDY